MEWWLEFLAKKISKNKILLVKIITVNHYSSVFCIHLRQQLFKFQKISKTILNQSKSRFNLNVGNKLISEKFLSMLFFSIIDAFKNRHSFRSNWHIDWNSLFLSYGNCVTQFVSLLDTFIIVIKVLKLMGVSE